MLSESKGIARPVRLAIMVEIEAAWQARIARRYISEFIMDGRRPLLRNCEVVSLKQGECFPFGIVVEFLKDDDVRSDSLDDLGHVLRLDMLSVCQVRLELACKVAIQRRIEGGNSKLGWHGGRPLSFVLRGRLNSGLRVLDAATTGDENYAQQSRVGPTEFAQFSRTVADLM